MNILTLTDDELRDLIGDIAAAESLELPGPAKQVWVIAEQTHKRALSPQPTWIFLLVRLLEMIIPELLDWLKTKYGKDWPERTLAALKNGYLPWHIARRPPTAPNLEAARRATNKP